MNDKNKDMYYVFVESNTSGTGYEFIRRASEKGYRVMLITADYARYKLSGIDVKIVFANTSDVKKVLDVCREVEKTAQIAGIMSTSEYYVHVAAAVAQELQLPGPSSEAVAECRKKNVQREAMMACGLACPRFKVISCKEDLRDMSLDFPVIVKPVSGSGSVGVRLCVTRKEFELAVEQHFTRSGNERGINCDDAMLVEEYIEGREYSAEVFGRKIIGFTAKHLGELPDFVEIGHDFPVNLPRGVHDKAEKAILSLCHYLGLDFGAKHVEFRIRKGEIYIIEVNPRLAGGHIPTVIEYALNGERIIDQIIDVYAGVKDDIIPGRLREPTSIRFILPPCEGVLRSASVKDAAVSDGVLEVRMYKQPGETIGIYGDFRDRIGHIIFESKHFDSDDYDKLDAMIDIEIE